MRPHILAVLLTAGCAAEPPYAPSPPPGDPRWKPAPVSRLPDSSQRIEHVRGNTFRVWGSSQGTRGAYGWPSRAGSAPTGTFGDLTPVRR
ncbi:hypothetical protein [Sabulicella glaciei]|uniref:Septal ring lytic transglycosylase RlpA family lipoprotein n=1 Tax=Sabulicella glaciei TaxID=2984948 RepID=A0ABT3NVQ0_9PROT|nr:hypothetical protein [Roseococcus sp. MDT2-1-1]MCW8086239.1 hypothetical protein [Roseococcus sp. MDT2-1-1]